MTAESIALVPSWWAYDAGSLQVLLLPLPQSAHAGVAEERDFQARNPALRIPACFAEGILKLANSALDCLRRSNRRNSTKKRESGEK